MPVSIQGFSVLARNASLERSYPGGVDAFRRDSASCAFCTDGHVARVGFVTLEDAQAFVGKLSRLGLTTGKQGAPGEVAVTSEAAGAIHDCSWLRVGAFEGRPAAWLAGDESEAVVLPDSDVDADLQYVELRELDESYDLLEVHASGVEVYRHRKTGRLVHTGTTIQRRCARLLDETAQCVRRTKGRRDRRQLLSIGEKARKLVVETKGEEAAPLMVRGVVARSLAHWDEAAKAFRRVTNLRPELKDGWLELSRCLCALNRVEEAAACAGRAVEISPEGPDTLGNLAAVFCQSGRPNEARPLVERALESDPEDAELRALLRAIEARTSPRVSSNHTQRR